MCLKCSNAGHKFSRVNSGNKKQRLRWLVEVMTLNQPVASLQSSHIRTHTVVSVSNITYIKNMQEEYFYYIYQIISNVLFEMTFTVKVLWRDSYNNFNLKHYFHLFHAVLTVFMLWNKPEMSLCHQICAKTTAPPSHWIVLLVTAYCLQTQYI